MPFTFTYILVAFVLSCLAGFLGYRKGGRSLALVAVFCAFAFLLVTLVGIIIVLSSNM